MGPGLVLTGREQSLTRAKPTLTWTRVLLQLWTGSAHHWGRQRRAPGLMSRRCVHPRGPPQACDRSGTRADGARTESHARQTNIDMQKNPAAALGRVWT